MHHRPSNAATPVQIDDGEPQRRRASRDHDGFSAWCNKLLHRPSSPVLTLRDICFDAISCLLLGPRQGSRESENARTFNGMMAKHAVGSSADAVENREKHKPYLAPVQGRNETKRHGNDARAGSPQYESRREPRRKARASRAFCSRFNILGLGGGARWNQMLDTESIFLDSVPTGNAPEKT